MKRALVLAGLSLLALIVQAAAGRVLAQQWCPDLGLLVVVGFAVSVRSTATGIGLAALVGYLSARCSGSTCCCAWRPSVPRGSAAVG
jgi:cell shape-determining protein MreD